MNGLREFDRCEEWGVEEGGHDKETLVNNN